MIRYLKQHGIKMPIRPHAGPNRGNLEWRRPTRDAVKTVLRHELYAGTYRYGHRQIDPRRKDPEKPGSGRVVMDPEDYHALIPNHCPAYITPERYERNQKRIIDNQFRAAYKGVPRDGPSLLSGVVYCGRCGRRLAVHYSGGEGALRYECWYAKNTCDSPICQSFSGKPLDELVTEKIMSALEPTALNQAVRSWLRKTPSLHTRVNYLRDLRQFLDFEGIDMNALDRLVQVHPEQVAAWRDWMRERGYANATIRRRMTALRSLFSYLQVYGYVGANPAHGKFVKAPAVSRDGKTVGLSPKDCRRLLEAPEPATPAGIRDRALLGVLAFSACRVGELVALRVGDFRANGEHRVLAIYGKGGRERAIPLHVEAVERLNQWIDVAGIRNDRDGALFRPLATARGRGYDGFNPYHLTTRAVEKLVKKYAQQLGFDPSVVVHSLRVTALTTARERGAEIIDLQDWAGHADPRTTLTYIRTRDRLSKSPGYILNY